MRKAKMYRKISSWIDTLIDLTAFKGRAGTLQKDNGATTTSLGKQWQNPPLRPHGIFRGRHHIAEPLHAIEATTNREY